MSIAARLVLVSAITLAGASPGLAQKSTPGVATISLTGDGVSQSGEYPTALCGGPYMLGKGMSYQVRAGEWQVTIASETRASGSVPLNTKDGVNVVATVNGKGRQFVRGPKNTGTFTVSADFRKAEANLELRSLLGKGTATLVATFVCQ